MDLFSMVKRRLSRSRTVLYKNVWGIGAMVENTQVAEDRQFSLVSPQGHMKSTIALLNSPAHLSSRDSSLPLSLGSAASFDWNGKHSVHNQILRYIQMHKLNYLCTHLWPDMHIPLKQVQSVYFLASKSYWYSLVLIYLFTLLIVHLSYWDSRWIIHF